MSGQSATDGEDFEVQVRGPLRSFIRTEAASAGLLVAVALLALLWANSPWSDAYVDLWHTELDITIGGSGLTMDLHHWVNDGLMVVFFFVIGLEVRREFAVGELTEHSRLVVPVVAGIGGMLVPAAIYLAVNSSGDAAAGWGVVIGTDTAFLLGALALVGPAVSTQLRIFLLTLTVIDDIVAVSVIGVVYSDDLDLVSLAVAAVCLAALAGLDRVGEWRASPYVAVVVVLWVATLESGVHAAIAGMVSGLLVPAQEPSRALVEEAATRFRAFRQSPLPQVQRTARLSLNRAVSVNERLQEALHGWTSYVVVPVFALANAGVDLRDGMLGDALRSPITWGVVAGLVLGKLVGIGATAIATVRVGLGRLPEGVGSGHVLGGAALSGIGFTVSLLIAELAFDDQRLVDQARVGILLAAVLATAVGWLAFRVAASMFDQRDAALPMVLSDPVDPEHDHILGPVDAPLTLVEYLDFECPFCAKATGAAHEVRAHFGDRLRYVSRHMPLAVHPHSELAGVAAEAAGRQGRYWEMHGLLFRNQDRLELDDLVAHAAELGLDVDRFVTDLDDDDLHERLRRDVASAETSGVRGTPTFFVGDRRHVGPYDAQNLIAALEELDRGRRV
ncbi:Na+/H+ antiporter NhaA [Nocardioides sp. TF02-7]|uniref:Na+/H+ antiporter NhaA n=1 Tax=Nocardioides sp. TF02-7 TaxID=2917724 RepID=UPI001F052D24|nr:Na+/H+ antiporter NhaA [Nocardioides sp. TF02-7]UMG93810.1 Na+/H+ antiporter NhaA [Nocardioides sp. TF02-7]